MSILYVMIMIGALVFFHELGHFVAAKALGVKVLRFSIGFGPKILGFTWGETEYVICALPLGGYVMMLGGEFADMEEISEEDRGRSLLEKPIWKRSIIVLAGPAFNILLPILIFFGAGMMRETATAPVVGQVLADTPAAQAGLELGDRIVAIDGEPIRYWHDLTGVVSESPNEALDVTWERRGERMQAMITPSLSTQTRDALGLLQTSRGQLGILNVRPGPTIAVLGEDTPAYVAGLRDFDRIVQINGAPTRGYDQVERAVFESGGTEALDVVALRPTKIEGIDYGQFFEQDVIQARVTPQLREGAPWVGLSAGEMVLLEVAPESAAAKAGLTRGDRITSVDGRAYNSWLVLDDAIEHRINARLLEAKPEPGERVEIEYEVGFVRGGEARTTTLVPLVERYDDEYKQERYRIEIGWMTLFDLVEPEEVAFPLGDRFVYSVAHGVDTTVEGLGMFAKLFQRIFEGRVSFSNQVGGPILIGELAARAGEAGIEYFLTTLAQLSLTLAVFNLLPIPLLDGGRLALYGVEAIKRGPLSFRARQITSYVGFVLIILLMILAFKNDIERNWDTIVDWLF